MTIKQIVDIADKLDWMVYLSDEDNKNGGIDKIATFFQYSPAGEDFEFNVIYEDADDLAQKIDKYCKDFDIDEHAKTQSEAKRNRITESLSVSELIEDARDINEMLKSLSDKINKTRTN